MDIPFLHHVNKYSYSIQRKPIKCVPYWEPQVRYYWGFWTQISEIFIQVFSNLIYIITISIFQQSFNYGAMLYMLFCTDNSCNNSRENEIHICELWVMNFDMISVMCHVHVRNPMSPLALAKVVWSIVQQSPEVSRVTIMENICDFSFRDDEYKIRDTCYSPLVDGKHTSKAHDNNGHCWGYYPGWGLLKLHLVILSASKIFDLAKVPIRISKSHSYLTGVTAAQLRRHLSNINVISNS